MESFLTKLVFLPVCEVGPMDVKRLKALSNFGQQINKTGTEKNAPCEAIQDANQHLLPRLGSTDFGVRCEHAPISYRKFYIPRCRLRLSAGTKIMTETVMRATTVSVLRFPFLMRCQAEAEERQESSEKCEQQQSEDNQDFRYKHFHLKTCYKKRQPVEENFHQTRDS